jgi:dihydrofolate reductase
MGPVEVEISMSVDGFITGPNEEGAGLGEGGEILHAWFFQDPDHERLADDALFATSGAVVTSRKIYDGMEGWGETGFYRMPVFVLTHRPHDVVVKGETTLTFVTEGIESAIAQAQAAAREKKVHIMGGATVIQQALNAGLVDSLHLHVATIILGAGTRLFDNLTEPIELERTEVVEIPIRHPSQIPRYQIGTNLSSRCLLKNKTASSQHPTVGIPPTHLGALRANAKAAVTSTLVGESEIT